MQVSTAMTTSAATTAATRPNTPSFDDMLAEADELGRLEGEGGDSQIRFALKLVEGAFLGALNLKKDSRGTGRDDATALSEKYFTARKKGAVFNIKAGKIRKLCSTHRRCIQLGISPRWGKQQPWQAAKEFVDQWMAFRKELDPASGKHPKNGRKLNDAFNAFQLFITAQMKSSSLLSRDERNELMWKKVADEKTETEKLEAARKGLIKSGDTSVQIKAAIDSITLRLANIAKGVK